MRRWDGKRQIAVATLLALAACSRSDHDELDQPVEVPPAPVAIAAPPPAPAPIDSAALRARIEARRDSVDEAFRPVKRLTAREVSMLRQDVNDEQIAEARRLGQRVSGEAEIERLRRAGRLVPLGDSTGHWVLREMQHSVPFVTPDTHRMLTQLGDRFHARLDSLGLPRFRMKITSVLRTDETQAELRRINPNASRIVSAHEFGTTVDVSHERFAVPDSTSGAESEMLEELGKEHSRALQAELGRAILEFKERGALRVMMEDRQPVYHMTVAQRFGPGS